MEEGPAHARPFSATGPASRPSVQRRSDRVDRVTMLSRSVPIVCAMLGATGAGTTRMAVVLSVDTILAVLLGPVFLLLLLYTGAAVPAVDISILRTIARLNPNMSNNAILDLWPVGTDPCDPVMPWRGVVCDETGQRIVRLCGHISSICHPCPQPAPRGGTGC